MKIFVLQTWDRNVESLEVKPSDTIGNIKSKISGKLGILTDDQILLYKIQPLKDYWTLLHYRIPEGATLDLRLKLRGYKHCCIARK